MARDDAHPSLTVVLHDDSTSKEHVLCGASVLSTGQVAYIITPQMKRLCFVSNGSTRVPGQISVHVAIARRFGIENRMQVQVEVADDIDKATASHVSIFFRDQHLSRADMWRIEAQVSASVLYQGQQLNYLGSNVANVEAVYIRGKQVGSAFILHPQTKLIFRSGSARYILLIEISKEMLDHWRNGDMMHERLVDGFVAELFSRWRAHKSRHEVDVIFFGREINHTMTRADDQAQLDDQKYQDFFYLVAANQSSVDHREMLHAIKKALNDVRLPCNVSLAAKGNMLEAINLAAADFMRNNIEPTLATTGSAIIAITAGSGVFETNHRLLHQTTRLLMGNSVGVDIVSLAPKPLHPVPLFQYVLEERTEYALPHWADISYWTYPTETEVSTWMPPLAIGEVQDVALPPINLDPEPNSVSGFDQYDEDAFMAPLTATKPSAFVAGLFTPASKTLQDSSQSSLPAVTVTDKPVTLPIETVDRTKSSDLLPAALKKSQKTTAPPHPLMQVGRTVSAGIATTSVSAHNAEIGNAQPKEPDPVVANSPSLLAKQIRATLRKRPSQASLAISDTASIIQPTKPIGIPLRDDACKELGKDAATLVEKAVLNNSAQSGPQSSPSLGITPKAVMSRVNLPDISAEDEHLAALTPWLTLLNPCNPRKDNMRVASEYRQWQNIFPTTVSPDTIRWDSMVTPAVLPLQRESRISTADLERHFTKNVRRLVLGGDNSQEAVRNMIAIRLAAGFQVVPTRKQKDAQMPSDRIDRMLLSLGETYHEIRCLSSMEIQVAEYNRTIHNMLDTHNVQHAELSYKAKLQPLPGHKLFSSGLHLKQVEDGWNWSTFDDQCINTDQTAADTGSFQMRLVLIPVPVMRAATAMDTSSKELSEEERRIEGIQKLTQLWQRHRHFLDEEEREYALRMRGDSQRDPDPLAIEYQTHDPSAVVNAYSTISAAHPASNEPSALLFPKSELFTSRSLDPTKLAKRLQEPPPTGVEVKDRRWFTRFHLKCFRGDEMTTWLLGNFKDLATREEAVEMGNQLMQKGLFNHVRGKHEFRDGIYFYQIMSAYRTTAYPDTASFFTRSIGRSVPSTPMSDSRSSPALRALHVDSDSSGRGSPKSTAVEIQPILLSQKLQYNVDPGKKSEQPEIVNLHYDRIHNPLNCYHIQLDWTITTPKFIRESVTRWSALVEGQGLRLVQLPLVEASRIHEHHPREQTVPVKLSVRPVARTPVTPQVDPHASPLRTSEGRQDYHKAVLRKNDFVLDLEAAHCFPPKLNIGYSWGRPEYQHTQFVHKSGLLLAQITNDDRSDFVLLRNRLAGQWQASHGRHAEVATVERIVKDFVGFCKDSAALQKLYEEVDRPSKAPLMSPLGREAVMADLDVPPMELPPLLGHRVQR